MSAAAEPVAWTGERAFTWPGTATQTALKVLDWAARGGGSAPRGSLGATADLAGSAAAATALRRLTRATAARLGPASRFSGIPARSAWAESSSRPRSVVASRPRTRGGWPP